MESSRKKLLIFTDLEGTILRESDGLYDPKQFTEFIARIDQLQKVTGQVAKLHIVSPMTVDMMKNAVDKIDHDIYRYNSIHRDENDIYVGFVAGATVSPEISPDECYLVDQRFMPMPKEVNTISTGATYGKEHYVKLWIDTLKNRNQLGSIIYCGNGRNDISAMRLVKGLKEGYIICPKNSKTELRRISNFVSNQEDLLGITEGLDFVIQQMKTKNEKDKNEDLER